MPNSRSSSRCSSAAVSDALPPTTTTTLGADPNDGRGDEIQPCPVGFHPMAHTPPPHHAPIYQTQEQLKEEYRQQMMGPPKPVKERRLPSRSGSTASLFSPFASLTRRLGAKHKSSKTTNAAAPNSSRMSTPVEFQGPPRSITPASSVYSTFPRIHSSSSSTTPSPSTRTPFISQLLGGGQATSSTSSSVPACPSCPPPGPSYSSSSRLSSSTGYPPMMMTEVLDEPVEEEVYTIRDSLIAALPILDYLFW